MTSLIASLILLAFSSTPAQDASATLQSPHDRRGTAPPEWIELFLRGTRALEAGRASEARTLFDRALAFEPLSAALRWQRACAAARLGDLDDAFARLGDAAAMAPLEPTLLEWDRDLARLRTDARFAALLERARRRFVAPAALELSEPGSGSSVPSRNLLIGVRDEALRREATHALLDRSSGEPIAALFVGNEWVLDAGVTPGDRYALLATREGHLWIFDARDGRELGRRPTPSTYCELYFDPSGARTWLVDSRSFAHSVWKSGALDVGRMLPAAHQGDWDRALAEPRPGLYEVSRPNSSLGVFVEVDARRDRIWAGTLDGMIRALDPDTGRANEAWRATGAQLVAMTISADGELLAVLDSHRMLRLFALPTGTLLAQTRVESEPGQRERPRCRDLRIARARSGSAHELDGLLVCSLAAGAAHVYSLDLSECLARPVRMLESYASPPPLAPRADGGALAVATEAQRVSILDSRGQPTGLEIETEHFVQTLAFEPSGEHLWIGTSHGELHVHDVTSGKRVRTLENADLDIMGMVEIGNITFSPDGRTVVVASSGFGVVAASRVETGERLWNYEYGGGNPSALHASFDPSGEWVAVWGQGPWTPRVVDARSGRTRLDLAGGDVDRLYGTANAKRALATTPNSIHLLDLETGRERWSRRELAGGDWVLRAPTGHVDGRPGALGQLFATAGASTATLEELASLVLDPKRVRAAAEGVPLARAVLHEPPTLRGPDDLPRVVELRPGEEPPRVELTARSVSGVAALESRVNGELVLRRPVEPAGARAFLEDARSGLGRLTNGGAVDREWTAIDGRGVRSRPVRLRIVVTD